MTQVTQVSPSLIPTLSGHWYTDPAVFLTEQEQIFESLWFSAARSADLASTGAFRTVQVGRESVIIVRHRDGSLRAFLNVCRHRGARVCADEAGEVKRNFRCAYHAWTYDLDGALIAAPNLVNMPDIDRRASGLISVAIREWLGYAWVCLADEPPSFEETVINSVAERLGDPVAVDHYGLERLALGRRITYDAAANWKLIIENFMECYHCATIHPELTTVIPEFSKGIASQVYAGHGALFGERIDGFTVDGSAGFDRLPDVTDDQDRRYYGLTVRPQFLLNLVPDHAIVLRLIPVAVDRTIIECDWLFAPEVIESGADVSASVELFDRVNRQDVAACELTQPSMSSRAYRDGGVLVPSEHHIAQFHQWVIEKTLTDRTRFAR